MASNEAVIRTPDQRLRVFVSSTLRELAAERLVVREAIERMSLAPVMFELGARPHPPRALYRAYLDQSDIFIGLYWESYGWVAPGEESSGLEDEYDLVSDIPLLIYVKNSEKRQERLERLLGRIRDDDRASYVGFDTAEELGALVTADLATLLAERFDQARHERVVTLSSLESPVILEGPPPALNRLIGRDAERRRCVELLGTEGCRIVTLTGPGGVGKTRLAIAAARDLESTFTDGVAFVDLAPIRDPARVIAAIATALGVRDVGDMPLARRVAAALDGRRVLLVLDNFEQVIDAAGQISALVRNTGVSVLATSRILLHVDGEQAVALAPIAPADAVGLFVERARAVKPDLDLGAEVEHDILAITGALDNLPLAIELAATRVRVLRLSEIVDRLDRVLPLLTGGARDHPDRQRALRATIEWSADLLTDHERTLLHRLAVFRTGFELDTVAWMSDDLPEDGVDLLTGLVESSLVQVNEPTARGSFSMLATVREYGLEELERRGEADHVRQRHAEFYSDLAIRAEPELVSSGQDAWMARLEAEFEDIRAAVEHYLQVEDADAVAQLFWPLYWFWWASGRVNDLTVWIDAIRQAPYELNPRTRLIVEFYGAAEHIWVTPDPSAIPEFERLLEEFVRAGDSFAEAFTRSSLALLHIVREPPEFDTADVHLRRAQQIAQELDSPFLTSMSLLLRGRLALARAAFSAANDLFTQALQAAEVAGDRISQGGALYELGWVRFLRGDTAGARELFVRYLLIVTTVEHQEGIALGLEGFFAIAASRGDVRRAGRFLGAAEDIRARRGLAGPTVFSYHQHVLAQLQSSPVVDTFEVGRHEGRKAELARVIEEALG